MSPPRRAPLLAALAVFVFLGLSAAPARAETIGELFGEANSRYWKADYEGARELYHRIVEVYRIDNAEVYLNLANAYAQLDLLGSAVLYYKRALRCEPSAETGDYVRNNLELVRRTLVGRHREAVEQNRMLFDETHGAWYALFHLMSEGALVAVLLVFYLSFVAAMLVRRLTRRRGLRRALLPAVIALLVGVVAFGGLLAGHVASTRSVRLGVVLHDDVKLRRAGAPDAPLVLLPEGLELRVMGREDDERLRVRLSNGSEGFVPLDSVKEI